MKRNGVHADALDGGPIGFPDFGQVRQDVIDCLKANLRREAFLQPESADERGEAVTGAGEEQ